MQPLGNYVMLERRGFSCVRSMELLESEKTEGMKAGSISGEGIPYSRDRRIIRVFSALVTQSCPSPLAEGAQGPEVSDSNLYLQTSAQKIKQNPNILMILQDFFFLLPHKRFKHGNHIYHSATQTLILSGFPVSSQHQQHSLSVAVLLQQGKFPLRM